MEHLSEETEERGKIRGNHVETEDHSLRNVCLSMPEIVTSYPSLDERETVKELVVTNYVSPSSFDIGCSSKMVLPSKKRYLHQLPENSQENSVVDEALMSIDKVTSTRESFVDSRSTTIFSSGFTQFFLGQSCKSVWTETKQACTSEEMSSSLTRETSFSDQVRRTHDTAREERLKLPHGGINLREWIERMGPNVRKVNKLLLFRKIVEMVDMTHARGMALVELRPSFFTLLPTGGIKYIGPLMEFESLVVYGNKKRGLDQETFRGYSGQKRQNLGKNSTNALFIDDKSPNNNASNGDFVVKIESKWYSCPRELEFIDSESYNVYCLGLLLFELLCPFESIEVHSAAMLDLQHRILPPSFVSEHPKEAGFCLWLLHPKPYPRPKARDILQSELFHVYEDSCSIDNAAEDVDDAELDLLHHFLVTLKDHKQSIASKLSENLKFLEADIKEVERKHVSTNTSASSGKSLLKDKLFENFSQLEDAYFCMRSTIQVAEVPGAHRSDKYILRDRLAPLKTQNDSEQKTVDHVETFFDGICKYARYKKFAVCGTLRNSDILGANNVICSLSFDRDEEHIAAAGVSKKIKFFEISSLMDDSLDVQYPALEMSNESKISCICWNNYIKNYLASTDYDGLVKMWDASSGQVIIEYKEHQQRAWSVDFSKVDPLKFASGSDDGSMRTWSINEKNSTCTIWCPANVCCVQFSSFSSHLLAFGSADYKTYCYDMRHTRIPWCTLAGHGKAVSNVRFLNSDTIISASTDNTLKLWDLNKTCLEGLSLNACELTFSGHSNEKNFVGLAALDGYIACGSETNEVYAYYRSLPMPITSHKFGSIDPISGNEISDNVNDHFVSSVCWGRKSEMIAAANSSGNIKLLSLA